MKYTTLASALAIGLMSISTAHADMKNIELRVGDSLPPDHIISRNLTQPWIEAVKEMSNGKIDIKYYPAEQAGKARDMLSLTQTGVLDIGYVGPAYVADKMPLSGVAELPGLFTSSCQVTNAYWSMAQEGGYFYEKEFKPNKIRPLFIAALPPYQVVIGNDKSISKLADFAGLKIRAAGGAQELTLRMIDMVPVKMAPPEIYESMSRGTIDGTLLPFISIDSYKLSPLAKTATRGANFGTVIVTYSISERKWKSLPKDVQDILSQAGDQVTTQACEQFDTSEQTVMNDLKTAGVKFVDFDANDKARLNAVIDKVAMDWAAKLDERNRPGTETLKAFNEALSKTN
ncbi:TRAP transporter substrate-binding protein DctP [Castellaniella sp.]|uniref:TRAP transporter substrate-binding protein n=1 Tax=Castellaniella sp. TaxID=1955812 RepID=UPI003A8E7A85